MIARELRRIIARGEQWRWMFPNIVVLGDATYGSHVMRKLLKQSPAITLLSGRSPAKIIHLTSTTYRRDPKGSLASLAFLYEKGFLDYAGRGGVALVLHESVIDAILEDPETAAVLWKLYRGGTPRKIMIAVIASREIPADISYHTTFFVSTEKDNVKVAKLVQMSRSNIACPIMLNYGISVLRNLLEDACDDAQHLVEKIFDHFKDNGKRNGNG